MTGNIIIVDDEKEIADLIEVYLVNEGFTVYKYYSGEPAMECILSNPIDLAILDIMLPDTDGFTLCRRIREHYVFPIIMLTARYADSDKIQGITIGADDYVTKPFNPLEVTARVKAQLRRVNRYDGMNPSDIASKIIIRGLELDEKKHTCKLYNEDIILTPIEFSIILYLAKNIGQVVSSEELFEKVWGEKYLDNNNTVMAHIARLRDKLHENARKPEYIKTVWGIGYKIDN